MAQVQLPLLYKKWYSIIKIVLTYSEKKLFKKEFTKHFSFAKLQAKNPQESVAKYLVVHEIICIVLLKNMKVIFGFLRSPQKFEEISLLVLALHR